MEYWDPAAAGWNNGRKHLHFITSIIPLFHYKCFISLHNFKYRIIYVNKIWKYG